MTGHGLRSFGWRTRNRILESPEFGALVVGAAVGLLAIAFTEATHGLRELVIMAASPDGTWGLPGLISLVAITATGCAIATAIGAWLLGEAASGGINVAIARYHDGKRLKTRTLWHKFIQSVLALGSGSAGGGEGPIGYMGAAVGATVIKFMRLPPLPRRALLAAGMGAGIASLFKAPIAGAIFAAEVLYRSMGIEARVLFVSVPASIAAFCVYATAYGFGPALPLDAQPFDHPSELIGYALLGAACAVTGRFFHGLIHKVQKYAGDSWRRTGISLAGGLCLGTTVALIIQSGINPGKALALLGDGYQLFRTGAVDPHLDNALILLAAVLGLRIVFSAIGIGTATGIGDFAPAVTIGGLLGALASTAIGTLYPPFAPPVAASAVVGMAAFYGGLSRAPLSGVLLVSEVTGRYTLMIPALWTTFITFRLLGNTSFYSAQKDRPESAEDIWLKPTGEDLPVCDALPEGAATIPVLDPGEPATRLILMLAPIALVKGKDDQPDAAPRFLLSNDILHHPLGSAAIDLALAGALARTDLHPVAEDDSLSTAFALMLRDGVNAIPVLRKDGTFTALTRDEILLHLKVRPPAD